MPIPVACTCGKRFEVPDQFAGRTGTCTACRQPIQIPGAVGGAAAGPVDASAEQLGAFAAGPGAAPPRPTAGTGVSIGRHVGAYEIQRKLGGPKSTVFLATNREGKKFALKVLPHEIIARSPTTGKRFLREARAAFSLDHPNVAKCADSGEELGTYFLAMEHFEGRSLQEVLDEAGGKLPEDQALDLMTHIVAGLGHIHQHGLVHRNLKPEHILIGSSGAVKLIGLGLIRSADEDEQVGGALTMTGTLVGTPQYMSPEQASDKDLDGRSDLYSAGTLLYRCLTGEVPFDAKPATRILVKIINEPPPRVKDRAPEVSGDSSLLVERLLSKDPAERPQTADEVTAELKKILSKGVAGSVALPAPAPAGAGKNGVVTITRSAVEDDAAFATRITKQVEGLDPMTQVVGVVALGANGSGPVLVFTRSPG